MATERTPLRTGPAGGPGAYDQAAPTYVFMTNPGRAHRNKIRQFQCCVCAAILGVFVMALVITISYSVEHDDIDNNRTTPAPPTTTTTALPPANGTLQLLLGSSWPKPDAASPPWPGPQPDEAALQRAVAQGRDQLAARTALEATMTPMKQDTPSYRANQAVHTRPEATAMAQRALLEEKATKQLLSGSGLKLSSKSAAGRGPRLLSVAADAGVAEAAACAEDDLPLPCPSTPYRSADGTCNNVDHPRTWGVALRPFRRVLPPTYEDGVSEPRGVMQGLPSAREVSLGVHRPLYRNDPDFTVMLAVWGQFIDHDITATALSQAADGSAISCCDEELSQQHPECFPVRLAPGDPFYHKYNVTCMEFVRSAPAPTCSLGQREQLNQATSFLDASVVYGPSAALMKSLREDPTNLAEDGDGNGDGKDRRPTVGRLKMTLSPDGRELLPVSEDPADGCNRQEMNDRGRYCFKSGDGRANENLHLTTMHLLLARQHNRLAASLQSMNPQWSDERVFQEARRIVAAQMQHVTYNEFLPVILGPRMMEQMDLSPKAAGYDSSYDPAVDPSICNSFAASSFRFAHTLLPGLMKLIGNDTSSPEYVELHQMLFDPYSLYSRGGADRALRGAMDTSIEKADNYFNAEVTTKLFAPRSIGRGSSGVPTCGLDLVSLNVQRGRDHGLQPYPAWREHCGFPRPASWDDLDGVVDEDSLQRMKQIYKSVDDVDVYTGVLSEFPVASGLLGGTLTCLLGDQFVRLKRGDRFWYETDQQPQAFTPAQLAEIRKTSLASIICGTSDGVHTAQPRVMRRAKGGTNERVPCATLPRTNLRAWVERDGPYVIQRADVLAATEHGPRDPDNVPDELVLVGAASSAADNAGLTPTAARAVRVGGHVTSGSVTTSSGASLWSGVIPAPIPTRGSGTFLAGGVTWEGSLVASGATASLRGTFAVDTFSPTTSAPPQAGARLEGRFDVDLAVLWDSSSDGNIDLSGSFRSPVYLRAKDGQHEGPLVSPKGMSGPLAPVILHGHHDANGTFLWDGNVTLVLPTMAQDSVVDDGGVSDDGNAQQLLSSSYSGPVAPSSSQVRVVADVLSGSVTAQGADGTQVTWWDGSLPADISTMPFDAHSANASPSGVAGDLVKPSARVDGVLWTATVASSSPTTAQVSGTFKAPRFVHGNYSGAGVQVEWWSGSFALNIRLLGRVDDEVEGGLEALLAPSQHYTSRLLFQADSPSAADPAAEPHAPLELMAAAQEVVDGAVPAPVILKGTFSADGKSFAWSGKVTLVLPRPVPASPAVQLLGGKKVPHWARPHWARPRLHASASGPRLVATVKSGSVTAGPEGQAEASVWSGSFPAAIPMPLLDTVQPAGTPSAGPEDGDDAPLYAHGLVWSGMLSTSGTTATLKGTFSAPRYLHAPRTDNTTGFAMEWWKGSFSLELEPTWAGSLDGVVDPAATYSSPVYFKGPSAAGADESPSLSGQRTPLAAFVAASLEQSEGALRAPLILQGTYSADRTVFYWSGALVLALPPPPPPPPAMPALPPLQAAPGPLTVAAKTPTAVRRIGLRVKSGNMYAYPEGAWFWRTWWSGNLPAAVPVPVSDSFKYEYAPYPTGPLYHACGVDWKGSITATSASTVRIQGKFSMPHYRHTPSGVTITWYYGTFMFEGDLLWSSSLQGLDGLDGMSFSSHLYFKSQKPLPISKYPVQSASPSSSLQQFVADSVGIQDGAVRVPIVLDGSYSADRHTFYWSGDAVITLPEPSRPALMLQAKAKSKVKKAEPSKPGKPTKPAKPAQPPKIRLMGMVVGGSANASYDNSTETEIWSGAVPMWLPNPLFGMASWDLDSTIKWSGSLSTLDKGGKLVQLDGKFTAPFFEQGADDVIQHEWKGTFSVQLRNMYTSVTQPELLKSSVVYTSKVVFVPPKSSSGGDDSATLPQLVLSDAQGQNIAVIVLQGQYWFWSKSWFWWNGIASIGIPLDDNSGVNPNAYAKPDKQMAATRVMASPSENSLTTGMAVTALQAKAKKDDSSKPSKPTKPAKPAQPPKIRLMGMVVGGSVNASYDNSTETEIWSGAVPVWLPNPLFGMASWDLDSTIKWSGSLSTLDKGGKLVQLDGEFTAPFFEQGTDDVIQHEWKGTFSVQLRNMYTSVTQPELLKRNVVYTSKVVFVPPKSATGGDDSATLPQLVLSDAQGQNIAVIVLQGQYWFWSKSWFWWNGIASIGIPLDDNSGVNPNAYAKPDNQMAATRVMASPMGAGTPTTRVAVAVVEGKVTGQRSDSSFPSTWWSGELPVNIPSSPFDGTATDDSKLLNRSAVGPGDVARGVSWTGSLRPLTGEGDNGDAMLEGSFRFPKFLHPAAGGSFSIEWWTGMFSLRLRPLAGTSLAGVLSQTAAYSSPIVFKAMEANESIAMLLKQSGSANADVGFVMASDAAAQGAAKLAVLLQGSYTPDRTAFSWTGNAVLVLPPAASSTKMPLRRLTASAKTPTKEKASSSSSSSTKIGAVVTSGTVSAAKAGGTSSTVWSGTFPVSLPAGGGGPASVLWSGSLKQGSSSALATLSGSFTTALPEDSDNATLVWWSGDFTLQLQLMWNASVTNCIQTGVKYVTPLYYRSATQQQPPQPLLQRVASLGQELASGGQQVMAYLDGDYSADKASFLWSGKVFLSLPKECVAYPTPAPRPAPLALKASASGGPGSGGSGRVTVGAVVSSGWVTPSLWSGGLPVAVPVAAIRSLRPLSWTGTLTRASAGSVSVRGKYTVPQYNHDGGVLAVDWIGGEFSFTARTLWDTGAALDGALTGTANYTSVVHLQNSDSLRALEDVQGQVSALWDRMMDSASPPWGSPAAARKVPIVLQGEFAGDGATFMWSGGVLIGLPVAV